MRCTRVCSGIEACSNWEEGRGEGFWYLLLFEEIEGIEGREREKGGRDGEVREVCGP